MFRTTLIGAALSCALTIPATAQMSMRPAILNQSEDCQDPGWFQIRHGLFTNEAVGLFKFYNNGTAFDQNSTYGVRSIGDVFAAKGSNTALYGEVDMDGSSAPSPQTGRANGRIGFVSQAFSHGNVYGVLGASIPDYLENFANSNTSRASGGRFVLSADQLDFGTLGTYKVTGVSGILDGTILEAPPAGVLCGVYGEDKINDPLLGTYAACFDGRTQLNGDTEINGLVDVSGAAKVTGNFFCDPALQISSPSGNTCEGVIDIQITDGFDVDGSNDYQNRILVAHKRNSNDDGRWGWSQLVTPGDKPSFCFERAERPDGSGADKLVTACIDWDGNLYLSGGVSEKSSRRFKQDIRTLESSLDSIERMRGVRYTRKSTGKTEIGVIAEEVAEVAPELVGYEEDGTTVKSVNYSHLTALLIEGMKEQQGQIDALKVELEALRSASE